LNLENESMKDQISNLEEDIEELKETLKDKYNEI
jgi:hypothetical protein